MASLGHIIGNNNGARLNSELENPEKRRVYYLLNTICSKSVRGGPTDRDTKDAPS